MPPYEKCENEGFRISSCGKIFAMLSHPSHWDWSEIQWHTLKMSLFSVL